MTACAAALTTTQRSTPPLTLYVHIPWCVQKCPYCDFNSHAVKGPSPPQDAYVDALLADLDFELTTTQRRPIESIFIGGGTPSLFAAQAVNRLLRGIEQRMDLVESCEITLEANPGTVDDRRFAGYRAAGVNRLSIGVQSFDPEMLKRLGRIHDGRDAHRAVTAARSAGFENFNLDLMFGLPGQTLEQAVNDVVLACRHDPTHISHYQLTIEPNTLFAAYPPPLPDDDITWAMFEACQSVLLRAGYTQYEVSAHARAGRRCRHNLNYWQFGDYLGIGAGAHGKVTDWDANAITRRARVRQPRQYLDTAGQRASIIGERRLDTEDRIVEYMMNALRLVDGVDPHQVPQRTGLRADQFDPGIERARARDLMSTDTNRIQATPLGMRFLNDLVAGFVADGPA